MAPIATYVFIDLETTSLPHLELNRTKITELSMVVMKRQHILDTRPGATPRVQHKLTMCFNPRRLIDPECTRTTGLCNDLLEHESEFNHDVFNTINNFIKCFEKPVCLIAQNGHNFDFPILKNHFEKLESSLPDHVMCADSLHAFYDLWKEENNSYLNPVVSNRSITNGEVNETNFENMNNNNKLESIRTLSKDNDSDNEEMIINEAIKILSRYDKDETDFTLNKRCDNQLHMKELNEKTPKSKPIPVNIKHKKTVKRKLFFEGDPKPKMSFKLKDLYERVLKRPSIDAHRAENDCIMAAELGVCKSEEFIKWIDSNHCAFADVKPMRLGVPLGE